MQVGLPQSALESAPPRARAWGSEKGYAVFQAVRGCTVMKSKRARLGRITLSRLFISHSSKNDDWAIALRDWLVREGWSGEDDIFLDHDFERWIAAGQRWAHALEDAATRCEAVLFLVSEDWLASKWCGDEYQLANKLNKKLFALLKPIRPLIWYRVYRGEFAGWIALA